MNQAYWTLCSVSGEDINNILMQNRGLGDSDHTCINFVLNCYAKVDDRIKLPNYLKANYKTIREMLSAVNWTSELDADFITGYINFIRILELSTDGCIPDKSKWKEKTYT